MAALLPGLWRDSLHVTCGLTACTPGSAPGPTLGNEYGKTLPYLLSVVAQQCAAQDAAHCYSRSVVSLSVSVRSRQCLGQSKSWIYTAHNRKASDALCTLAKRENKSFQVAAKTVSGT